MADIKTQNHFLIVERAAVDYLEADGWSLACDDGAWIATHKMRDDCVQIAVSEMSLAIAEALRRG